MSAVAGCGEPAAKLDPPAVTATTPPAVASSAVPSPSLPSYDATQLNLCKTTDLTPVKKLASRVTETREPTLSGLSDTAPGSACAFTLKTGDGHEVSLLVLAATPKSVEVAVQFYESQTRTTVMTADGPVPGLGEEAEDFTRQNPAGGKQSEYRIHTRTGNLVVMAFLTMNGDTYPTKETLSAPCRDVVANTLRLATKSG